MPPFIPISQSVHVVGRKKGGKNKPNPNLPPPEDAPKVREAVLAKRRNSAHLPRKQQTASAEAIKRSEDLKKALDLRLSGYSTRQIGALIGRAPSWVVTAIEQYNRENPSESAEAYRIVITERQQALIQTHWENRHDPKSADIIIKCDNLIANVTGAKAPERSEISGPGGGPLALTATPSSARLIVKEIFGDVTPTNVIDAELVPSAPDLSPPQLTGSVDPPGDDSGAGGNGA